MAAKVHPEKREAGVRYGIDQSLDCAITIALDSQVRAPEGNDAKVQPCAATKGEPVRPRSRAEDCKFRLDLSLLVAEHNRAVPVTDRANRGSGADGPTAFSHFICHRACDQGEVHDSCGRRPKRRAPGGRGLELGDTPARYTEQPRYPIGAGAALERVEGGQFIGRARDHQLAATARRYRVSVAIVVEGIRAAAAEDGLERTGTVIQAGVDHPAVVTRLVGGDQALLLHDHDARGRKPQLQLPRNRQPEYARPDHRHIALRAIHQPISWKTTLETGKSEGLSYRLRSRSRSPM